MSTPNKYQPDSNTPIPVPCCPHCGQDLPEVSTYQWTKQIAQGVVITLAIYCPNAECRKLMGTQMLIVQHAEEQGMIHPPH